MCACVYGCVRSFQKTATRPFVQTLTGIFWMLLMGRHMVPSRSLCVEEAGPSQSGIAPRGQFSSVCHILTVTNGQLPATRVVQLSHCVITVDCGASGLSCLQPFTTEKQTCVFFWSVSAQSIQGNMSSKTVCFIFTSADKLLNGEVSIGPIFPGPHCHPLDGLPTLPQR